MIIIIGHHIFLHYWPPCAENFRTGWLVMREDISHGSHATYPCPRAGRLTYGRIKDARGTVFVDTPQWVGKMERFDWLGVNAAPLTDNGPACTGHCPPGICNWRAGLMIHRMALLNSISSENWMLHRTVVFLKAGYLIDFVVSLHCFLFGRRIRIYVIQ